MVSNFLETIYSNSFLPGLKWVKYLRKAIFFECQYLYDEEEFQDTPGLKGYQYPNLGGVMA
jgi:hypothetical protein